METQFAQRPDNVYREGGSTTQPVNNSAVSWCAVFAGALASAALSLILLLLGTGFGLTLVSPWAREGISGSTFGVSSIIGITLISLAASALGGYLAGRLRTRWLNTHNDEVHFRDTAHGFLSWAVATLGTAIFLTSVVTGIVTGGVKAGAAVASGAATAATGAVAAGAAVMSEGGEGSNTLQYFLDSIFRADTATDTPSGNTGDANGFQSQAQSATPETSADGAPITTPMPQTPAPAPQTSRATVSMPSDSAKAELARIFVRAIATDSLPQQDVEYAGRLVAQATGLDPETAEKRVADGFTALRTAMDEAETTAREAADTARKVTAYTSLWLFISLLAGAFVASLMAVYGGRKRDLY